jgi:hypothetical protein
LLELHVRWNANGELVLDPVLIDLLRQDDPVCVPDSDEDPGQLR